MQDAIAITRTPSFEQELAERGIALERKSPTVLQINIGKLCNLTCVHCHVNAGPKRKEIMTRETVDHVLEWLGDKDIEVVDLTGGTPEMIPDFRYFVKQLRSLGKRVMVRCNLTILNEPGYDWVAEFHAAHQVEIIASMPCYCPENVNAQRGEGVFDSSILALQRLNNLGFGTEGGTLKLDLVYNPNGATLPPDQKELEGDYKRELRQHFGIVFHNLYAITNMPVSRFTAYLRRNGQYEDYMQLLLDSFNPAAVEGLMCRDTLNVDWLGNVYDCDFNQQLRMNHKRQGEALKVWDVKLEEWEELPIMTGKHCFGCTAGSGSSCGGTLT